MHQHSNRHRPGSVPLLMVYSPRWHDYPPPGPWLVVRSQFDPIPHTDSVGRSEHAIGTEALVGALESARSLVKRSVAPRMSGSTVIGLSFMLALGSA